jgi:hypothetical protein
MCEQRVEIERHHAIAVRRDDRLHRQLLRQPRHRREFAQAADLRRCLTEVRGKTGNALGLMTLQVLW